MPAFLKAKREQNLKLAINKEKKSKMKQIIKENISNEFAQGVVKIFETPFVSLKIFWSICLTVSSTLSFYMIVASFLAYFDYEVSTTSRRVYETPSPFPIVTICNYNPIVTEYGLNFVKTVNENFFHDDSTNDSFSQSAKERKDFIATIFDKAYSKMLRSNFSNENRKKLGHNLEDILFDCQFNGKPCGIEDFTWRFSNFYGNCFVFNEENRHNSFIAGSFFGLKLQLYANFNQNLSEFISPYGAGIYLRVENSTSLQGESLDGIILPTGFVSYISMDRVFNYNFKRPYSNCDLSNTDDATTHDFKIKSDPFKIISHSPFKYTQELCLFQCLQKKLLNDCNCADPYYVSLFENVEYCETENETLCKDAIFNENILSNFIKDVREIIILANFKDGRFSKIKFD